jgi:uncharacterized protein
MTDVKAILPTPTADSEAFWQACNDHRLVLPSCVTCSHLFYYPRQMCPRCGGADLDWREVSGRGRVYSFTHVEVSFYGPMWEPDLPYTVVLVDLEEGPRMLSRLVDAQPTDVAVGAEVYVKFVTVDGQAIPMFRLR